MNQDAWNSLSSKVAERDEIQARLEQLRTEIQDLAASLEQELAQFHETEQP